MNNKELTEFAAKACRFEGIVTEYQNGYIEMGLSNHFKPDGSNVWNPLYSDGDAFRLAAHLRIEIKPGKHKGDGCTAEAKGWEVASCTAFHDDPCVQMRKAILIVAAEIGKKYYDQT